MTSISINRQVHFAAGTILVTGLVLEAYVNRDFIWLARLVGFGLFLHAFTGFCLMQKILRTLPWNKKA